MTREHVAVARGTVAGLAVMALLAQVWVVPRAAAEAAVRWPEVAHLEVPYLVAVVGAILAFEVALVAAWMLLGIRTERLTAPGGTDARRRARRRAHVMTVSLVAAAVILAGVLAHAAFVENVGGPPSFLGLIVCLVIVPVALRLGRGAVDLVLDDDGGAPGTSRPGHEVPAR